MITNAAVAQSKFMDKQLSFERVKTAYLERWNGLRKDLTRQQFAEDYEIFMVAYKEEGKFQLWCKNPDEAEYRLFKTYDFCEHSGTLGPKVKEGDLQTPEGFYKVNVFNPESSFYLSLGINYPNKVDLARTGKTVKPGGDIYIHGNCVTVGCIPLTDDKIKEVYLLALFAKGGRKHEIPVYIFPFKMTASKMKKYTAQFPQHAAFWETLQLAYQKFEQNKTLPHIKESKGVYLVK